METEIIIFNEPRRGSPNAYVVLSFFKILFSFMFGVSKMLAGNVEGFMAVGADFSVRRLAAAEV